MPRIVSRNTTLTMLSVLLLIVALLVAGLLLESSEHDSESRIITASDYLLKTRIALGLMTDMETGMRGYLLSGDEQFLDPYNEADKELLSLWNEMNAQASLIDAYPLKAESLLKNLATMKADADKWQSTYAKPQIELRRTGNIAAAIDRVKSGDGKAMFDAFRMATNVLEKQIKSNLVIYSADLSRVRIIRQWLLMILGFMAVGSVIFALRALQKDVLRRAEAIDASLAETERLRTVIEYLPVAVRVLRAPEGEILLQNKLSSELIISRVWNEVGMENFAEYLHIQGPDGKRIASDEYPTVRSLREGITFTNYEIRVTPEGEPERTLLVSSAPLRDEKGNIQAAVAITQDITDARERDHRKDDFIATAAHELRNPLTALSGHYQLLERGLPQVGRSPTVRRHLDGLDKQIKRMNSLIERLLDASRIELGRLVLDTNEVELCSLTQLVAGETQASAANHTITASVPAEPLIGVWDGTRVEQVLSNLLNNAVRYSPAGSEIRVSVSKIPGYAKIEVIDNGPGIKPEQIPSLFERYYQAGTANTSTASERREHARSGKHGLGLGLYISHEIVRSHGGQIGIEPNPQGGSIFWFTLPRE